MSFRHHGPPQPLLFGYDPVRDLPPDHLARFVEQVVEATVHPPQREKQAGQPPFDPRLCLKVLIYGYATGVRSSRQLARHCQESLPYLFLTRGDTPSYQTLGVARTTQGEALTAVWEGLFAIAAAAGIERVGRIVVDSTKLRANASSEAVLKRAEFAPVRAELARILAEAAQADAQEDETPPGSTTLSRSFPPQEEMREILRRVRARLRSERRPAPTAPPAGAAAPATGASTQGALPGLAVPAPSGAPPEPAEPAEPERPMTSQMLGRVRAGLAALQAAAASERQYLCLTDPEAEMMHGGRERQIRECHSFEVAVDQGLLVAANVTQESADNARLAALVALAARHEPLGVGAVTGDCGYYAGDAVGQLLEQKVDLCIPDSNTACDLHRGLPVGTTRSKSTGSVEFRYEAATDSYHCPEGNVLVQIQVRQQAGQRVKVYRAQRDCRECPRAAECLRPGNGGEHSHHRTLKVGYYQAELAAAQARFGERDHQERYHHRGEAVETIFGFLRSTLGFGRWLLRGAQQVAREGQLFALAYQVRKVRKAWAGG